MDKEAQVTALFQRIIQNDISGVDKTLREGDSVKWRELLRYELEMVALIGTLLRGNPLAPKLVSYEITRVSAFHLSALLGHDDILVHMMDKEVPVDLTLSSGSTVLHMAAFGGRVSTARLLVAVYKANINKQDNYGWSALHYACTEGHRAVVEMLVNAGIDIQLRDKDGTSAAFRAQVYGHEDIVTYLCNFDEEDSLLNVDEDDIGKLPDDEPDATYSIPYKTATLPPKSKSPQPPTKPITRQNSLPNATTVEVEYTPPVPPKMSQRTKSRTMPSRMKQAKYLTIRRIIREQLETVMGVGYMQPSLSAGSGAASGASGVEEPSAYASFDSIGLTTFKSLLSEELENYKKENSASSADGAAGGEYFENDEEDPYMTVGPRGMPQSPGRPGSTRGPPLPPPRQQQASSTLPQVENDDDVLLEGSLRLPTLNRDPNPALSASLRVLSSKVGKNWKQLARALPLESTASKVEDRIKVIEKQFPKDPARQAQVALSEWQINHQDAEVDDLILALRKCGLHSVIPDVERVTSEFTA